MRRVPLMRGYAPKFSLAPKPTQSPTRPPPKLKYQGQTIDLGAAVSQAVNNTVILATVSGGAGRPVVLTEAVRSPGMAPASWHKWGYENITGA